MKRLEFNVNQYVYARLTPLGETIYRTYWAPYARGHDMLPKADERGFRAFQMWTFMQVFGPHMGMGKLEYPFDLNVEFDPPEGP